MLQAGRGGNSCSNSQIVSCAQSQAVGYGWETRLLFVVPPFLRRQMPEKPANATRLIMGGSQCRCPGRWKPRARLIQCLIPAVSAPRDRFREEMAPGAPGWASCGSGHRQALLSYRIRTGVIIANWSWREPLALPFPRLTLAKLRVRVGSGATCRWDFSRSGFCVSGSLAGLSNSPSFGLK